MTSLPAQVKKSLFLNFVLGNSVHEATLFRLFIEHVCVHEWYEKKCLHWILLSCNSDIIRTCTLTFTMCSIILSIAIMGLWWHHDNHARERDVVNK